MCKFILKTSSLLAFCVQINISEAQQWVYQDQDGVTLTFNYQISNVASDTSLTTSLVLNDPANTVTINWGTINLNSNNVRDTSALGAMLANMYSSLFNTYGIRSLNGYVVYVSRMVTAIADTMQTRQLRSLTFQSLCMYLTLSKAANRDLSATGNVNFTISENYFLGINSFSAEEDIIINIADFKQYLNNLKDTSTNEGIDYFLGALARETSPTLSMVEIRDRLDAYFNLGFRRYPTGGQCGCCGNYPGVCYLWSPACLIHDLACRFCIPKDFCGSDCKISSCKGNTISWYYWL